MAHTRRHLVLAAGATALLTTGLMFGAGAHPTSAATSVSAVTGSAYGFSSFNITLFGGAQHGVGPTPTVTLASNASNSPQSGTATTGLVQYGPATLFSSDAIAVQTSGSLGATGSSTSTSSVKDINKATTQTSTGSEPLTAGALAGSCSASASGTTGSTTITSGILRTDSGLDLNNDGNYTDPGEHPPVDVTLPTNPAPNTSIPGVIYIGATSKDSFHFVFDESSTSAGTLTINPVHEYFDGPTLTGNLVVGQVVCGLTASVTTPPSPSAPSTTPGAPGTHGAPGTPGAPGGSVSTPATGSGGMMLGTVGLVVGGGLLSAVFLTRRRRRGPDAGERS